jgi:Tol biopolymer transport system component
MPPMRVAVCALTFGALIGSALPSQAGTVETIRASVSSNGDEGDGESHYPPTLAGNGRFVAFSSAATNLVADDENGSNDVFVHNRVTGKTTRVSVRSNGNEAVGESSHPSLSSTGRFVAFHSSAALVGSDDNGVEDIYVHDREVDGASFEPSISGSGRYVAFVSQALDLVPEDNADFTDVFVHDRETGKVRRVSVSSSGAQADEESFDAVISSNGRFVAFQSQATNLAGNDALGYNDVFVHNRKTKKTIRASVNTNGEKALGDSTHATLSGNGRYVAFESFATNLVANDENSSEDIFLRDLEAKKTKRISVRSNGDEAEGSSEAPEFSDNGRYVTFESGAANLVSGDGEAVDIFLRNLETKKTKRVSAAMDGSEPNNNSYEPSISSDGRWVAFYSDASDLVPDDTLGFGDIFMRGPLD